MESIISTRKAGLNITASIAILVLAIMGAAAAYQPVYKFWLASPVLNSVILAVFAAGAIYALYCLFHLQREFAALEQVQRRCGASDNVKWLQDDFIALLPQSLVRERLLLYFEQIDRGAPPNGDNHSERISLTLNMHTSLTRYIASVLVFMGLLGTFIGLLQAIAAIGNILTTLPSGGLNAESATFFNILKQGLSDPLRGMATAFSTSLFGMLASLLIGFIHVQLASAQSRYISRLETLDAAVFRPSFGSRTAFPDSRQEGENPAFASMHFAGAQRQLKENLDRLMAIVDKTQAMQANFREVMVTIGREIEITIGARAITAISPANILPQLLAVSSILAWSGISIIAQVMSIVVGTPVKLSFYLY